MTQTNSPSSRTEGLAPRDPAADTDPLLHLHRMSTTAGVGTGDYVAVNVTSVVAVVFGLASLLAMANPVLLVFPIVGVILGLIALGQIVNSNGTQTGKGLAILGLALSGIITATIFCVMLVQYFHQRADRQAVADLAWKYGRLIAQDKFDDAYDLFDSDFKYRVSKQAFIVHLTSIQHYSELPPIDGITWNGRAEFHSGDDGAQTADAVIKVHFKGIEGEERLAAHFCKANGGPWQIDNIPDQFPPIKSPPGQ
ncbi:MAG: DUF4190 domain-containing protein [Tepidisphaeraceae bacterium]